MSRARPVSLPLALPVALVALAAVLAGCADDDPADPGSGSSGSSAAAERLAAMPGMEAASVERQVVDEDVEVTQVVVDADAGATADQVADVVDEVLGHEEEYAVGEAPVTGVVYLGAGGTQWADPDQTGADRPVPSGVWWGSDQGSPATDDVPVLDRATWLVDAAAAVPGAAVVVDHDDHLSVRLPDFDPARVGEVATTLLGTASLADAPTLVSAGDTARVVGHGPVATLAGAPLTPGLVRAWTAYTQAAEGAGDLDVRELSLGPLATGELDVTLPDDEVHAVTTVRLPGGRAPEGLTVERYGAVLLPVLRGQLAALEPFAPQSSLTVVDEVLGDDGEADDVDVLAVVRRDGEVDTDPLGRGWGAALVG